MNHDASLLRISAFSLCLLAAAAPTATYALRCGGDPGDAAKVAAVRGGLKTTCNCGAVDTHGHYLKCVAATLKAVLKAGQLPKRCRSQVARCASRSVFGKPGGVVCCRTNSSGLTTGRVVRDANSCRAPVGGSSCVSAADNVCDGCEPGGCVPPSPTPTPEPTATATPEICPQGVNGPPLAHVPSTTLPGTMDCGSAQLQSNAAPPYTGAVYDGTGNKLGDLGLGCQYAGALAPVKLPDGATSMMDVVGISSAGITVAGGGTDRNSCTRGSEMTKHCINGQLGPNGDGSCTADADCAGSGGACARDANCFFGAPIPVPNGLLSACVMNAFLDDLCGHVDFSGTTSLKMRLASRLYATSNATEPCPLCVGGQCDGGPNKGNACTAIGSAGTSADCPPEAKKFLVTLDVPIGDLSTGASEMFADAGHFCPVPPTPTPDDAHRYCVRIAPTPSAFGIPGAAQLVENGAGASSSGLSLDMTLAGLFCIPSTGSFLDQAAQIVGPGAVSVQANIDLTSLLGLPGLPPLP
ncbi:MAG: hypothetical protein HY270_20855 [Deltaproteobacteria bacterium]|nr:hypothetical protein [Deltaproteobacteria bacterium]